LPVRRLRKGAAAASFFVPKALGFVGSCGRFPVFSLQMPLLACDRWQLWAIMGVCG
jgi:hypothetical protein